MGYVRSRSGVWGGLLVWMVCGCATMPDRHAAMEDPLVEGFSQVAVASVADAMDQVVGRRGFMSHEIKPIFPVKMCGRAITVLSTPSQESRPPDMALELIDTAPPGSVLVLVMEGPEGADVGAFGGIMCTGAHARGLAGAVLDGGCRDVVEIEEMGFPVFARAVVPSSSVGRYVNVSSNQPVMCGGVMVHPNDIIVGDMDGVAVVPREQAAAVLERARDLEAREALTARDVKRLKSIREATRKNKRI